MLKRFEKQKEKEREHAMPSLTWNRSWVNLIEQRVLKNDILKLNAL